MKILVYGSESFDDYSTFMRGLVVAIEDNLYIQDDKIEVLTAGPHKINNFTAEFINRTEDYFKQKGIRTKFSRVRKSEVVQDFDTIKLDHIISFNKKTDPKSYDVLMQKAEEKNINSSYYKY